MSIVEYHAMKFGTIFASVATFASLFQTVPISGESGLIAQLSKLGLTTAAIWMCWILWNKLSNVEKDRDARIAAKDELLLSLHKQTAEMTATFRSIAERIDDTLREIKETQREVSESLAIVASTCERVNNVRNVMGAKHGQSGSE